MRLELSDTAGRMVRDIADRLEWNAEKVIEAALEDMLDLTDHIQDVDVEKLSHLATWSEQR
jgi:hypothetical protein